jgi:hypothetical protein
VIGPFEESRIESPLWLKTLVEEVIMPAIAPLSFMGPLGYRCVEPDALKTGFNGWQVAVFPLSNRIVGANVNDGALAVSGFQLDVLRLTNNMRNLSRFEWRMPMSYSGDLDGPALLLEGEFLSRRLELTIFNLPPADEAPAFTINPVTKEIKKVAEF